jgi:hypothetical protein
VLYWLYASPTLFIRHIILRWERYRHENKQRPYNGTFPNGPSAADRLPFVQLVADSSLTYKINLISANG